MKYTQEQLDGMSIKEKNEKTSRLLGLSSEGLPSGMIVNTDEIQQRFDVCANSLGFGRWQARVGNGEDEHWSEIYEGPHTTNTNPLIAIVDCFLMMNEDK